MVKVIASKGFRVARPDIELRSVWIPVSPEFIATTVKLPIAMKAYVAR